VQQLTIIQISNLARKGLLFIGIYKIKPPPRGQVAIHKPHQTGFCKTGYEH